MSGHSWLSLGSKVSTLVAIVVAGDSVAADGASGPLAGALVPVPVVGDWDTVDVGVVITLVPVPVSALVPDNNDMIAGRGAAAAAAGAVKAEDSFGPLGAQQLSPCWYLHPYRCVP